MSVKIRSKSATAKSLNKCYKTLQAVVFTNHGTRHNGPYCETQQTALSKMYRIFIVMLSCVVLSVAFLLLCRVLLYRISLCLVYVILRVPAP